MLLLSMDLMTETEARFSANETVYKGSVFHGLVERALSDKSIALWRTLRGARHERARYALIPPQDSKPSYPAGHRVTVGVVLYGSAAGLWHDVLDSVMASPRLGLGSAATPVVVIGANLHHPNHPSQTHLQAVSARNPLPLWKAPVLIPPATGVESLSIELLSPTQINSKARREAPLPLTLSSIVKSLQQRLTELEPALAERCGFDSKDWQDDVRACWPHQISTEHEIHDAPWIHQSRNTRGPVVKQAILGRMRFEGATPARVISLLDLGQWLAMGQSCSLGQGWYQLRTENSHSLRPPPLLSPQASDNRTEMQTKEK